MFENYPEFLAELGRKPSPKHSLDRIDNDGHYEKGNVRWATRKEQSNNTRQVKLITINGETAQFSHHPFLMRKLTRVADTPICLDQSV